MHFYGNIQKVDVEQRMVFGYASTEAVDLQGETILKSAIESALDDYMEYANIREMHQLSAVGTAEEASVDDKGLYISAKVVDDTAWEKVTSGVYKGFSIGGKTLARDPDNRKIITKILMTEISLVDRPTNPEARFDVWKAAGSPQEDASMATKTTKPKATEPGLIAADQLQLSSGTAAESLGKAVDAALGEGDPAETNVGQDVAAEPAAQTEVAKADGAVVTEPPAETPAADVTAASEVADPIAKATAALDLIDAAVASVAKTDDLEKGLYHVGRFAEYLEGLSYLASSVQSETDFEGDDSPVPAKMRDWLKAGAAIFKDLAKEEVDEFVASFKAQKAAVTGDVTKLKITVGGEDLTKSITDLTTERDALVKTVTEKDDALAKLADRIEPLAKTIDDLTKRLAVVEASPAPAKTAGAMATAVSKEADAGGAQSLEKTAAPSQEDIAKALSEMTEEDRAMLLIKAAQQLPRPVSYR